MEKKIMTSGTVNNEVDFCKVYDMDTKQRIEKILLKNRISYSCRFEEHGLLERFLSFGNKDRITCVFRIHDEEVPRAKALVASVLGEKRRKGTRQ